MKRIIAVLGMWLWGTVAFANVPCSLPFNLQNNTTADATQVMSNYNALITCLGNAAIAGSNADITALLGLTTPIPPSAGGTTSYLGGTSTGTANAQVVAVTTPPGYTLSLGDAVTFKAGFSNTGQTTLQVGSTGVLVVDRKTNMGDQFLVGGEIVAGNFVQVRYDGVDFQIVNGNVDIIGQLMDWSGATAPAGWLFADGSCAARQIGTPPATDPLFTLIGITYDPTGTTCDTAHFALPDFRGRVTAYQDTMGINGAAGRLTAVGSAAQYINTPGTPLTQTTPTLPVGVLTLSITGTGSATMSAGTATGCGTGSAAAGSPVTVTITAPGTCVVTMAGSPSTASLAAPGCTGSVLGGAGCGSQYAMIGSLNLPKVNYAISGSASVSSTQPLVSLTSPAGGITAGAGTLYSAGTAVLTTDGVGLTAFSGGAGAPLSTTSPMQVVTKVIKL